jgi:hypothetical protein
VGSHVLAVHAGIGKAVTSLKANVEQILTPEWPLASRPDILAECDGLGFMNPKRHWADEESRAQVAKETRSMAIQVLIPLSGCG